MLVAGILIPIVLAAFGLWAWRRLDHRDDHEKMLCLAATQPKAPGCFDSHVLDGLPEPARRYFRYTIEPGTPLFTVAKITMAGRFGMGTKAEPKYLRMTATQLLAMPAGFVWKMSAGKGLMRLSGSDSECWTRFWLLGLLPVARLGGDPDHTRSAFGRYVAEAVFWTPAALLPGPHVRWEHRSEDCARVTVCHLGYSQSVDVTVAPDGQPIQICFERWSNANARKIHQFQPFGGYLSAFRNFSGFRLPTHVEAGNHFGSDEYFPFFVADVTDIEFPRG
ncbi:DUF6544 family protein [Hydrocarboniclastica marina]|uniref:Uncharacterized protein n=1 Tax=Hydrocarboniclastica marina TaxID=2259620 RepID=A0A4P7XG09_9ALTE|nr:DUF6544 family protein [Hydrocarboniclastica marina]MAL96952.1 hypothetical protein [Alteromonadaceae bacterium]QCF25374.1 hypothetical protein soil367_05200 [Hydrocarboniclastica marina]